MTWVEATGSLAAALVLATFCMKTMLPLRMVAIVSNVAFIFYGAFGDLHPVLILHAILLPLNIYRLYQIDRLVRQVSEASKNGFSLQSLAPMMSKKRFVKGERLFRKGDSAHDVFVIASGTVRIDELDTTVGPGQLVGEIGVFSPDRRRTQSVSCLTDVEVLRMTDAQIYELYFQNPKLGFFLMRLIIGRLLETVASPAAPAALSPAGASADSASERHRP